VCRAEYIDLNVVFGAGSPHLPRTLRPYSDPGIDGHLHYPNDLDRSLNETVTDKIRVYLTDYNNRPSNAISFMPGIPSTSGC
jgi:hypothetical protein